MPRVVSLYLPTWPTDRLRRKMGAAAPDAALPLVLVGQTGRRRDVVAANAAALRLGLRVGMPATKAQALVKELVIHDADPAADARRSSGLPSGRCAIRRSSPPTIPTASSSMRPAPAICTAARTRCSPTWSRAWGGRHNGPRRDRGHLGRGACLGPLCGAAHSRRAGRGRRRADQAAADRGAAAARRHRR